VSGWLIDTRLFKHLGPGVGGRKPSFRDWVSGNTKLLYLSMISLVEIEAEIEKLRARGQVEPAAELDVWLGRGLVAHYSGRIHPVDAEVAMRAGVLRSRSRVRGPPTIANLLLAATAQIHGHGILTERGTEFRSWAGIELWDPFDGGLPSKGGA